MIVGLTGYAGSGKDTLADMIVARRPGWVKVSLASTLYKYTAELDPLIGNGKHLHQWCEENNLDPVEALHKLKRCDSSVRSLLQKVGVLFREKVSENYWVDQVKTQLLGAEGAVLPDCRFLNEVKFVWESGGMLVGVTRPGVGLVNNHVSETSTRYLLNLCLFKVRNDGSPEDMYHDFREQERRELE